MIGAFVSFTPRRPSDAERVAKVIRRNSFPRTVSRKTSAADAVAGMRVPNHFARSKPATSERQRIENKRTRMKIGCGCIGE
jgi:hypothetical protein